MNEPLVSVIVPIYNVEKYLDKCVESIVNQTYKNLEIILVDDGSPDECPYICDMWKEKDSRIKVIHKVNGGLSDARNAGLDICLGQYVSFIDSDDYVSQYFIETLLHTLIDTQSDIVSCSFKNVYEDHDYDDNQTEGLITSFNRHDALLSLVNEHPLKQVVWNKLYKKELFDNLRFEVGKLNEDDFFTYKAFALCDKVTFINNEYYFYLIRNTSIMGQQFSLRRLDGMLARSNRYKFLKENYSDIASIDKKVFIFYAAYCYQRVLLMNNEEEKKEAKRIIKQYYNSIAHDEVKVSFTSKEKIWYTLMSMSLEMTCKLRNKLKINV